MDTDHMDSSFHVKMYILYLCTYIRFELGLISAIQYLYRQIDQTLVMLDSVVHSFCHQGFVVT